MVSVAVQFGTAVVLARILGPAAFGTVALAALVTGFAAMFNNMGIGPALVQRKTLDHAVLASAFYLNLLAGVVLGGLVVAMSPWIADFFEAPDLRQVLSLSALSMVLSVSLVPRALLQRRLLFGSVMSLDLSFGLISSVVSVGLALAGVGVLSIPIGAVTATLMSSILAFLLCPWRPNRRPTFAAARSLWSYSGSVFAFDTLNYWGKNLDNLLVGKVLGTASLGYYARAYNLMQLPVSNLQQILNSILFPTLSRVQSDLVRFARGWLVSVRVALFLGLGIAVTASVNAYDVTLVLYGMQWLPMAPALAVLMAATPAYILSTNASVIFMALGRTGLQLRLGLATVTLRAAAIIVGLQWGYRGVAVAILISGYLNLGITLLPAMRVADIGWVKALHSCRWLLAAAAASVAAGVAVQAATEDLAASFRLLVVGGVMGGVYLAAALGIDRALWQEVRDRRPAPSAADVR